MRGLDYQKSGHIISLEQDEGQWIAERANSRSGYRGVCDVIRHYRKACGNVAYALCKELSMRYGGRPAFVDELSKVIKSIEKDGYTQFGR